MAGAAPRKYNPGFLTDGELVTSFCVRMVEFESIVEMLRECTGSSNPHQIVIGPRGSGKTSLLLRVAAEVRRDAGLSSGFFPIVFAEESYEVATAGEFWLECLSRLADQAPHREGGPDLRLTFEHLRTIRDDRTLGERCMGVLQDFSDRESKRLVLMVENLNMMFSDMADPDAGWRLRKVLQTEPRIILLASATSRFEEIDNPDCALFDQFRTLTLRPLDTNECAVLWERVSGRCAPPETIRSLEILTGGSPRLIAILARFGGGLSFRELMADLLDLVDDHTEYFKSHLESLPAQERRVYLALAGLWKPALTKEVADRARLETSKCSAQLTRLVERGTVQVAGGTARRKQYYLSERLYNIYYLLRRNRGPDRLIEALIRFMASYYSPDELKDIGTRMIRDAGSLDLEMLSLHQAALERLMELPALAEYREDLLATIPEDFADVFGRSAALPDAAKTAPIGMRPDSRRADQLDEYTNEYAELAAARVRINEAFWLEDRNRMEEALDVYDEVVSRFGESQDPTVLELVAAALAGKGVALGELNRPEDKLAAWNEVVHRFEESDTPVLLQLVATALSNKGATLGALNRLEEALATWDDVVRRFGGSDVPALVEQVAKALVGKGGALGMLNRPEEALAAWDEMMRRFGGSDAPALAEQVAKALVGKGAALGMLNRPEEALATWDEVVRRYGESEAPAFLQPVATALFSKGATLGTLNRPEEALATWDEMVRRFEGGDTPAFLQLVAAALVGKGAALGMLNRPEEALAAWDEMVRRYGESEAPALLQLVAIALFSKGATLGTLNRLEEALVACDEVVHRFEGSDAPVLVEQVAKALVGKGAALDLLNRPEEALATYDEVVHRFGENDTPTLLEQIAKALVNKGVTFGELNRPEEALAVWDEVVRRFEESDTPALLEQVAKALVNKGVAFGALNRLEEALAAWDEVVRRFGESESSDCRSWAVFALLVKAEIDLALQRYGPAIEAAGRVLDPQQTGSQERRLRGHLVRARALLEIGRLSACEQDIEAALAILPEIASLPKKNLDALVFFSAALGPERMRDLIQASPAADLLLPLTTALEWELGLEPRVAREVEEVARDIRRDFVKLKEVRTDGVAQRSGSEGEGDPATV